MSDKKTKVIKLPIKGQYPDSVRLMLEDNIEMWRGRCWHYLDSTTVELFDPDTNTKGMFIFLIFCKQLTNHRNSDTQKKENMRRFTKIGKL